MYEYMINLHTSLNLTSGFITNHMSLIPQKCISLINNFMGASFASCINFNRLNTMFESYCIELFMSYKINITPFL